MIDSLENEINSLCCWRYQRQSDRLGSDSDEHEKELYLKNACQNIFTLDKDNTISFLYPGYEKMPNISLISHGFVAQISG